MLQVVNGDGEVLAEKAVTMDAVQEVAKTACEGGRKSLLELLKESTCNDDELYKYLSK